MTNNLPAHLSKAIDAMEAVSTKIDTTSGGEFSYLKLTKAGEWVHGADDNEVAENSVFAVSTDSFFMGFQAWEDGVLEGEETALFTEHPILRGDLPDVGADWKSLLGFQLVCVDGDDKGLQLLYKTTSKGGIKEVNNLMKSIVAHVKSGKHEGKMIPEIELLTDKYKHKKYGTIYTPILEIVDWLEAIPSGDATSNTPEPEQAPEPEVTNEPVRRRRRA